MTYAPDNRIHFANHGPWGAYSQREMALWATQDHKNSLAVRVLLAALGRHGRMGHAELGVRELGRILGTIEDGTGRLTPAPSHTVSKAIRLAKERGYVTADSNARCLVLSEAVFQKASGSKAPCRLHPRM